MNIKAFRKDGKPISIDDVSAVWVDGKFQLYDPSNNKIGDLVYFDISIKDVEINKLGENDDENM